MSASEQDLVAKYFGGGSGVAEGVDPRLTGFAAREGFTPTSGRSGKHNRGSKHPRGLALDVRTRDHTPEEVENLLTDAGIAGHRALDERVRPKGQKEWGGPHVHLEIADEVARRVKGLRDQYAPAEPDAITDDGQDDLVTKYFGNNPLIEQQPPNKLSASAGGEVSAQIGESQSAAFKFGRNAIRNWQPIPGTPMLPYPFNLPQLGVAHSAASAIHKLGGLAATADPINNAAGWVDWASNKLGHPTNLQYGNPLGDNINQYASGIDTGIQDIQNQHSAKSQLGQFGQELAIGAGALPGEMAQLLAGGAMGLGAANLPIQGALGSQYEGPGQQLKSAALGAAYHYGGEFVGQALAGWGSKWIARAGNALVWTGVPAAIDIAGGESPGRAIGRSLPFGVLAGMQAGEPVHIEDPITGAIRRAGIRDLVNIRRGTTIPVNPRTGEPISHPTARDERSMAPDMGLDSTSQPTANSSIDQALDYLHEQGYKVEQRSRAFVLSRLNESNNIEKTRLRKASDVIAYVDNLRQREEPPIPEPEDFVDRGLTPPAPHEPEAPSTPHDRVEQRTTELRTDNARRRALLTIAQYGTKARIPDDLHEALQDEGLATTGGGLTPFGEQVAMRLGGGTKSRASRITEALHKFMGEGNIFKEPMTDGYRRVFHGTDKDFNVFEKGDIGFHFGTRNAANTRLRGKMTNGFEDVSISDYDTIPKQAIIAKYDDADHNADPFKYYITDELGNVHSMALDEVAADRLQKQTQAKFDEARKRFRDGKAMPKGQQVLAAYLRLRNPVRTADVHNFNNPAALGLDLKQSGAITPAEYDTLRELLKNAQLKDRKGKLDPVTKTMSTPIGRQGVDYLRNLLKSKGYDGIVYANEYESKGEDSYIVFDPEQIKSATGNRGTYDATDRDIMRERSREFSGDDFGGDELDRYEYDDEGDAYAQSQRAYTPIGEQGNWTLADEHGILDPKNDGESDLKTEIAKSPAIHKVASALDNLVQKISYLLNQKFPDKGYDRVRFGGFLVDPEAYGVNIRLGDKHIIQVNLLDMTNDLHTLDATYNDNPWDDAPFQWDWKKPSVLADALIETTVQHELVHQEVRDEPKDMWASADEMGRHSHVKRFDDVYDRNLEEIYLALESEHGTLTRVLEENNGEVFNQLIHFAADYNERLERTNEGRGDYLGYDDGSFAKRRQGGEGESNSPSDEEGRGGAGESVADGNDRHEASIARDRLTNNPVRLKGFNAVNRMRVASYLDDLYQQVTRFIPEYADLVDESRGAYERGDTKTATRLAENALQYLHTFVDDGPAERLMDFGDDYGGADADRMISMDGKSFSARPQVRNAITGKVQALPDKGQRGGVSWLPKDVKRAPDGTPILTEEQLALKHQKDFAQQLGNVMVELGMARDPRRPLYEQFSDAIHDASPRQLKEVLGMMREYNTTLDEFLMEVHNPAVTYAAKILNSQSQIAKMLNRMAERHPELAQDIKPVTDAIQIQLKELTIGGRFRNIMKGAMVATLACATRNGGAQLGLTSIDGAAHALNDSYLYATGHEGIQWSDSLLSTGLATQELARSLKNYGKEKLNNNIQRFTGQEGKFQIEASPVMALLGEVDKYKRHLYQTFSSDVQARSRESLHPSVKSIHGVLDGLELAVKKLNRANQGQETAIRTGVFTANMIVEGRRMGVDVDQMLRQAQQGDLSGVEQFGKDVARREKIQRRRAKAVRKGQSTGLADAALSKLAPVDELVQRSVKRALDVSMATDPEKGTWAYHFVNTVNKSPLVLDIPFPRFITNLVRHNIEYSPAGFIKAFLTKPEQTKLAGGKSLLVSKALVGSGLFVLGTAIAANNRKGNKWYEVQLPWMDDPVDIRPYQPFAGYIYAGHLAHNLYSVGTLGDGFNVADAVQQATGYGSGRQQDTFSGVLTDLAAANAQIGSGERVGRVAMQHTESYIGNLVSRFAQPASTYKDFYAIFDQSFGHDQERVSRDTSLNPIAGPTAAKLPGLSQALPPVRSPIHGGDLRAESPWLKQISGVRRVEPHTPLERQVNELEFPASAYSPSTGDPQLDYAAKGFSGQLTREQLDKIVQTPEFQSLPREQRGLILQELLGTMRQAGIYQAGAQNPEAFARYLYEQRPKWERRIIEAMPQRPAGLQQ